MLAKVLKEILKIISEYIGWITFMNKEHQFEELKEIMYMSQDKKMSVSKVILKIEAPHCNQLLAPWRAINSEDNGPSAVKTALGWI